MRKPRRGRKIETTCLHCGSTFLARADALALGGNNGRFCSVSCGKSLSFHPNWNGGRYVGPDGYVRLNDGTAGRLEHVEIAERALGRPLPSSAEVHHVNGVRADNAARNLVICQDHSYHMLLHRLARIRRAGGSPFQDSICSKCRQVKPISEFTPVVRRGTVRPYAYCKRCQADLSNARYHARRTA